MLKESELYQAYSASSKIVFDTVVLTASPKGFPKGHCTLLSCSYLWKGSVGSKKNGIPLSKLEQGSLGRAHLLRKPLFCYGKRARAGWKSTQRVRSSCAFNHSSGGIHGLAVKFELSMVMVVVLYPTSTC